MGMRLCSATVLPSGRKHYALFSAEEDLATIAMASRLNHCEILPILVAARQRKEQVARWSIGWDDPVV
jgi:hypothetical protein